MRLAAWPRLLASLPALSIAVSCSEPRPAAVDAVTGLWEIDATFTEYTGADHVTVPVTGPSFRGSLTIDQPDFTHATYFTWESVKGAFVARPCSTFGSDGQCAELGEPIALDGVSGSITIGPEGPGQSGSYLGVGLAPMHGYFSVQDIVVRGGQHDR